MITGFETLTVFILWAAGKVNILKDKYLNRHDTFLVKIFLVV